MHKAMELLRAANVLHRAVLRPRRRMRLGPHEVVQHEVYNQVFMLGAMALECALKADIAAHRQLAVVNGQLPLELRGHALDVLLERANAARNVPPVVLTGNAERDVVVHGESVIAYAGRYPATLRANEHPRSSVSQPAAIVPACNRLGRQALGARWARRVCATSAGRPRCLGGASPSRRAAACPPLHDRPRSFVSSDGPALSRTIGRNSSTLLSGTDRAAACGD